MKVYDLEQPRFRGMPLDANHKPTGYSYIVHRKHRDVEIKGPTRTGASGLLLMSEHSGTHIDALNHQALNHRLYGGIELNSEMETPYGITTLGVEKVDPIVTRGVLLDLARFKSVESLPKSYKVTSEELQQCCLAANIAIRTGDVVLVRTGYGKFWKDEATYLEAAGVSVGGARWLASMGVRAVGADNMSFEVDDGLSDPEMGVQAPCHVVLIVENGIYIIENLNLEELASDKVSEFLFVCSPLKLIGATGSPVRPLALTEYPR